MKKIIFISALMLTLSASAQVNFPGKYVDLLLNRELKVGSVFGDEYQNFSYRPDGMAPYKKLRYGSDKKALQGRIFKVTEVKHNLEETAILTLTDGKETIYYNYNSNDDYNYKFEVVGGLELPLDYFCEQIELGLDDNEFKIYQNKIIGFGLSKTINKKTKKAEYELAVSTGSSKEKGAGVTLELLNGKKIERPKQLVGKDTGKQILRTFLELTDKEIALLTESEIKTITMAGQVVNMDSGISGDLRGQLKCLLTKE
ncbi:hypothetical protein ACLI09_07625 [Flavobacterium sp. RHBU_24]|uniref:hypothetical protein n=1 Tax=Flavobacterium sp. RHBU_24 TaxID=3391185 RepID=UPI0039851CB7